ncbi:MAG: sulfatase [Verrucomicrobiales bacterium]|nr:sulfatase [Verrucomicrobiales bacterium]
MMKLLLLSITCLAAGIFLQAADKPNVLFVMSDDLNFALSGHGHPECKTPNLDEFAKSAISFTRAYCQFPLCGPSRASIMTGQYPDKNGVTGNSVSIDQSRVTMPLHFQNHGYWSGRVSKIYHMGIPQNIIEGTNGGDHDASWSERYNTSAMESMTPGKIVDYLNPDDPVIFDVERKRWKEAHAKGEPYEMITQARSQFAVIEVADEDAELMADTMTTNKAVELLEQRRGAEAPFFLAVGFVRPHFPFISTENSIANYKAEELRFPSFPADDYDDIPPQAINAQIPFPDQSILELRRGYYGSITFMDQQFGRLITELERLKLRDKTIIVFVSDHGYLIGEHEMHKKSKRWEEAIHVPLMISVPGVEGGTTCEEFVELIDLYPTLSELAGLPIEPDCQGLSLASLINNPGSTRSTKPDAFIQVKNGYGLRKEKWAFMYYPETKKDTKAFMLFDMENDPEQFTNLIDHPGYADIAGELKHRLNQRIATAEQ